MMRKKSRGYGDKRITKGQAAFLHAALSAPVKVTREETPNFFDELYDQWQEDLGHKAEMPKGPRK